MRCWHPVKDYQGIRRAYTRPVNGSPSQKGGEALKRLFAWLGGGLLPFVRCDSQHKIINRIVLIMIIHSKFLIIKESFSFWVAGSLEVSNNKRVL